MQFLQAFVLPEAHCASEKCHFSKNTAHSLVFDQCDPFLHTPPSPAANPLVTPGLISPPITVICTYHILQI